jgi:hypothetical protein
VICKAKSILAEILVAASFSKRYRHISRLNAMPEGCIRFSIAYSASFMGNRTKTTKMKNLGLNFLLYDYIDSK